MEEFNVDKTISYWRYSATYDLSVATALVGYLYTAQSYVVESEKPLYDDINQAINNLGSVMSSGNGAR